MVEAETLDCVTTALLGDALDFGEGGVARNATLFGSEGATVTPVGGPGDNGSAGLDIGELDVGEMIVRLKKGLPSTWPRESREERPIVS